MKQFVKKYWKTLLFFAIAGLVGGFCTGLYGWTVIRPRCKKKYCHRD